MLVSAQLGMPWDACWEHPIQSPWEASREKRSTTQHRTTIPEPSRFTDLWEVVGQPLVSSAVGYLLLWGRSESHPRTSLGVGWWMPAQCTARNGTARPCPPSDRSAAAHCSSSSWKASCVLWEQGRGDDGFIAWSSPKCYILLCVVKTGLPFSRAASYAFGFTAVQSHQVAGGQVLTCRIVSKSEHTQKFNGMDTQSIRINVNCAGTVGKTTRRELMSDRRGWMGRWEGSQAGRVELQSGAVQQDCLSSSLQVCCNAGNADVVDSGWCGKTPRK